mgnify:CR=1 FL=1
MSDLGNKQIMANNIKKYMKLGNKKRTEICEYLDIPYTTFSDWINAKTYPRIDKIEKLANYFGVEKSDLVEEKKEHSDEKIYKSANISFVKIPLYGPISCGTGAFIEDNVIDYIAVPDSGLSPYKEYFAQIANGNSMIDAGIANGDIVVFEKSNMIDDGKIGCFCIDDGVATCKKIKKGDSFIQLIPANPKYDPIVIDLNNTNFRVIGILKKAIKDYS